MSVTAKQISLLTVIVAGDGRDNAGNIIPADLDQILERLDYKTTKESLHFSLRAMTKKAWIYKGMSREMRRGRQRTVIFPTVQGRSILDPTVLVHSIVEAEGLSHSEGVEEMVEN